MFKNESKTKILLITVWHSLNVFAQWMGWAHSLLGSLRCLSLVLRDLAVFPAFSCIVLAGDKPFLWIFLSDKRRQFLPTLCVSKAVGYCLERSVRLQSFLQQHIFASSIQDIYPTASHAFLQTQWLFCLLPNHSEIFLKIFSLISSAFAALTTHIIRLKWQHCEWQWPSLFMKLRWH